MQVVEEWARENGLILLDVDDKPNVRVFYLSEGEECLQVVVEDKGADGRIDVWSVEANNDEEFHFAYEFPATELLTKLDEILPRVRGWLQNHDTLP